MTRTFTFGELKGKRGGGLVDSRPHIHYCEYCGEEAKYEDIGDRCFEYVYWCECEMAKKESELYKTVKRLELEIHYVRQQLERMGNMTCRKAKQMKYDNELEKLKKKYEVSDT